ncbi:MAG: DUF115 domain-containing protein [Calditrichaeota bacterium]|nr:DUF115 domain-containing protein [Calditrichota bacterium]MCB9366006.1 DUF115 domain-containing protein [Calditrichota bacterium]MCB9391868.1 DUF115 domain-containing protein [Calditrichota bacterium]
MPTAVIGAGPSLTPCAGSLKSYREELFVIAASGAVPSLLRYGVIPDLAVAMEAKPESAADIEDLPDESLIVVFPWTAPKVMRSGRSNMVVADEKLELRTSGGSTALAAADLATRLTTQEVYLLGMDLSDQLGTYAHGALREERHVSMNAAKWSVMRAAFDSWVSSLGYRKIFHVLQGTVAPLNGTTVLSPQEFHAQLLPLREAITTA